MPGCWSQKQVKNLLQHGAGGLEVASVERSQQWAALEQCTHILRLAGNHCREGERSRTGELPCVDVTCGATHGDMGIGRSNLPVPSRPDHLHTLAYWSWKARE